MPKYRPGAVTLSKLDLGGYYLMTLGEPNLKEYMGSHSMNITMTCPEGFHYWKVPTDDDGEPAEHKSDGSPTDFFVCMANDLAVAAGIAGGESESGWEWKDLTGKKVLVQLKWSRVSYQKPTSRLNVEKVLPASDATKYNLGCDPNQSEPTYQESEQAGGGSDPFE